MLQLLIGSTIRWKSIRLISACSFEKYLLLKETGENSKAEEQLKSLQLLMRNAANNYLEYAFDYSNAGCFTEAIELLQLYVNGND